jgi:nicotinamidase-related amidase
MHRIDLPRWAVARGSALNAFARLEVGATALVNIDMQTVFLAQGQAFANPHARDIVGKVNALSRAMRKIGAPVIWTRQTCVREGPLAPAPWQYDLGDPVIAAGIAALQAGADGQALYPAMEVDEGDIVVDKYRYGAFSCPAGALGAALSALGTRMVVLTGTQTNLCCETTAREANMAGYKVIVVSDATASLTDAEHNAALLNLRLNFADVRRARGVVAMIRAAGEPP